MNPKKVKRSQSSRNLIAKKSEWKSVRILNPLKIKGQQQRKYYNKEKMNWRRCPRVGKILKENNENKYTTSKII